MDDFTLPFYPSSPPPKISLDSANFPLGKLKHGLRDLLDSNSTQPSMGVVKNSDCFFSFLKTLFLIASQVHNQYLISANAFKVEMDINISSYKKNYSLSY